MVVLFLLDVAVLLYPLDLMNPQWEFQTVGNIVERVIIPIIGLGFIFFGGESLRHPLELLAVKILSWLSLVIGVVFIVALPLVLVTSSQRIAGQIDANLGGQFQEQMAQSEALEEQIVAVSPADLEALIAQQAGTVDVQSPEEARELLLSNLGDARRQLQVQVQDEINQRKGSVRKNAVKWILGSVISGALMAYLWRLTQWARLSPAATLSRKTRKA